MPEPEAAAPCCSPSRAGRWTTACASGPTASRRTRPAARIFDVEAGWRLISTPTAFPYCRMARSRASCRSGAASGMPYLLVIKPSRGQLTLSPAEPRAIASRDPLQLRIDDEAAIHEQGRGGHVARVGGEHVGDRARE